MFLHLFSSLLFLFWSSSSLFLWLSPFLSFFPAVLSTCLYCRKFVLYASFANLSFKHQIPTHHMQGVTERAMPNAGWNTAETRKSSVEGTCCSHVAICHVFPEIGNNLLARKYRLVETPMHLVMRLSIILMQCHGFCFHSGIFLIRTMIRKEKSFKYT